MQVKPRPRSRAYASVSLGDVISRAKDTHTPNRVFRLGDEWDEFGEAAGKRQRAKILGQLVRWYLRYPGAKLPTRPPLRRDAGT